MLLRLYRRMRTRLVDDAAGFSVMEMLLVFTLIGIAMIPMAAIQFTSRREVSEAERMSTATQMAMSQVERVKLEGFASAAPDTLYEDPFTIITTVLPDSTNPFLREVSVRVVWDAADGERDVTTAVMQSAAR